MIPPDTSPEAHRAQIEAYRRMTPGRRTELAFQMSYLVRETARAGIRSRHPDYSETEVEMALRRLILGHDLFGAAHPEGPLREP
ncbi:MAG: hypothetical protein HY319_29200 [Armatimonadetes bacterium]|nr:hypothetical protein [Armatimonadota bacterium]